MGWLLPDRRTDDTENSGSLLGLSSRFTMPKDVRKERDTEVAKSIARTQVIEVDILGIERATEVGVVAGSNINNVTQAAINRHPWDADGAAAMAATGKAAIQRRIQELGGPIG
jgi:hypothetical protein